MKRYLILIGALFFMSLPSKSQDCVIDLTTGTDFIGNIDPIWEVRTPTSVLFVPVTISTGVLQSGGGTLYPNTYAQNNCGQWISPHLNAGFNIVAAGAIAGIYTYQTVIEVDAPCGIDSARLTFGFMAADNFLQMVRVNDINYPPPVISFNPAGSMSIPVALDPGINVIEVDVNNWGAYTGLQLCGDLSIYKTVCPEDLHCCDAPAGNILSWTEVPGAVGYDIEFGFNDTTSVCCDYATELPTGVLLEDLIDNIYLVPDSFTDCFWWRVRAVYSDGSHSEWSEKECDCLEEPVNEPCETPIDLSCTVNSAGRVLSWTPVVGASFYEVMINYYDPECCPVGPDLPYSNMYTTTDNFYDIFGFNECFSWKVRTHCTNGGVSEWSEIKCSDDCFMSSSQKSSHARNESRYSVSYDNISTSVVPNPANDVVTITIADKANDSEIKNATLAIFDLTGKEIYSSTISLNESKQIDVSNFNSGIYLFKVINNGKMVTSDKLVIQ